MTEKLENIICDRVLKRNSSEENVVVRVCAPRPSGNPSEWHCYWQIIGLDGDDLNRTIGSDSIQALYLTLEAIRMRLENSGENLTWEGGEAGDPGFPRLVPDFRGRRIYKKLCKLIDAELAKSST